MFIIKAVNWARPTIHFEEEKLNFISSVGYLEAKS